MSASTQPAHIPLMLVLSSPSGAGKSTMSSLLLAADPGVGISVSATTRPPRPVEKDGVHYHFLKDADFDAKVAAGAFIEHAQVHGYRYGTLKSEVEKTFATGKDVLFDIDWQGTQQIASQVGSRLVSIFLLPPSMQALEERLRRRAQDSEEVVQRRMAKARDEISHWAEYDYVLINDDRDRCFAQIRSILACERLKRIRRPDLAATVKRLIAEERPRLAQDGQNP
ncbi:MAG: guanylate kinase [Pseudomonadota bacterium]